MPLEQPIPDYAFSVNDIAAALETAGALSPDLRKGYEALSGDLRKLYGSDIFLFTADTDADDSIFHVLKRDDDSGAPISRATLHARLRAAQGADKSDAAKKLLTELKKAVPTQKVMRRKNFAKAKNELCSRHKDYKQSLIPHPDAAQWKQGLNAELRKSRLFSNMPGWIAANGIRVTILQKTHTPRTTFTCSGYARDDKMEIVVITDKSAAPNDLDAVLTLGHEGFHLGQVLHAEALVRGDEDSTGLLGREYVAARLRESDARAKEDLLTEDLVGNAIFAQPSAAMYADKYAESLCAWLKNDKGYVYYDALEVTSELYEAALNGKWPDIVANNYPLLTQSSFEKLATLPNGDRLPLTRDHYHAIQAAAVEGCARVNLSAYDDLLRPEKLPGQMSPGLAAFFR